MRENSSISMKKTNKSNNNTRTIIKWFITMDFCGQVNQIYMCAMCVLKSGTTPLHRIRTRKDSWRPTTTDEEDENNNNTWTNKEINKRPSHSQRNREGESERHTMSSKVNRLIYLIVSNSDLSHLLLSASFIIKRKREKNIWFVFTAIIKRATKQQSRQILCWFRLGFFSPAMH